MSVDEFEEAVISSEHRGNITKRSYKLIDWIDSSISLFCLVHSPYYCFLVIYIIKELEVSGGKHGN